jgi:hypothetical protein
MGVVQGNGGISVVITPGGGCGETHNLLILSLYRFDNELLYQYKQPISSVSEKKHKKILVSLRFREYNMWKSNLWRKKLC